MSPSSPPSASFSPRYNVSHRLASRIAELRCRSAIQYFFFFLFFRSSIAAAEPDHLQRARHVCPNLLGGVFAAGPLRSGTFLSMFPLSNLFQPAQALSLHRRTSLPHTRTYFLCASLAACVWLGGGGGACAAGCAGDRVCRVVCARAVALTLGQVALPHRLTLRRPVAPAHRQVQTHRVPGALVLAIQRTSRASFCFAVFFVSTTAPEKITWYAQITQEKNGAGSGRERRRETPAKTRKKKNRRKKQEGNSK